MHSWEDGESLQMEKGQEELGADMCRLASVGFAGITVHPEEDMYSSVGMCQSGFDPNYRRGRKQRPGEFKMTRGPLFLTDSLLGSAVTCCLTWPPCLLPLL